MSQNNSLLNTLKFEYGNKRVVYEIIISVILLAALLVLYTNFLNFVEARKGVILPDPILKLFNPVDLTWLTFGLIYLSLIAAIISLVPHPAQLTIAIQSYFVMVIFRIAAMYSLPLEPPSLMIPLQDPLVEIFGTGQLLTKDLFFSGHTATLFLLFLVSKNKNLKILFLVSTIMVGFAVLFQHVHYTIDVLAAPFFTYGSYRITLKLKKRYPTS